MTNILRLFLTATIALFAPVSMAQAYDERSVPARADATVSQAELDQILAPVALYPDSLLSQLLIAATYPRDIAEAAAWSRANPQLRGDAATRAVENEPWDPSVKSLVAFPEVLQMMDERMQWTERLGDAFMSAPEQVADTVQLLRGRADQAGSLRSSEELVVRRDYGAYVIEPAQPEVVYVPYYDPRVAYGRWWWPDYEPVWWSPWAGYRWTAGYGGFGWGYGITLGSGFWFSSFDWPRRYIRFYSHRPHYYRGHSRWHGHRWHSDRDHRRNVRHWHRDGDRRWDRDGDRRGDIHRGDGRRGDRDGRGDRRWDGRGGDGRRDGRTDGQRVERAPAPALSSGIQRSAETPRYRDSANAERRSGTRVLPAAPVGQSGYSGGRAVERAPRQYVAPAPAAVMPQPLSRQAVPSVQHAPVQHGAPAAAPMAREPRAERSESRPQRSERAERSDSRPERGESRSDGGSRGSNPVGRGGGRQRD